MFKIHRHLKLIYKDSRTAALVFLWAAGGCLALHASAHATDFSRLGKASSLLAATSLIEVKYDADHTQKLGSARAGSFETSGGSPVSFRPWYQNNGLRNTSLAWATPVTPSLGVIWGLGTGERGDKYSISPSLKLGLAYDGELAKNNFVSIKVTTVLGGRLKEKPCTADYGEIGGGEQQVNCRLAGTALAPAQTLQFLFNEKPYNRTQFNMNYRMAF